MITGFQNSKPLTGTLLPPVRLFTPLVPAWRMPLLI